jgi:hypothetical protein
MVALHGRKRSSNADLLSFFLEDWKFLLQVTGALCVVALIEVLRSYQFSSPGGLPVPMALVAAIHGLAVLSLLVPAYVFALASRSLLPQGSLVFRRLLAALLLAAFLSCSLLAQDQTTLSAFQWSLSDSFQQANYFAAGAGSIFFLSVFVVAYRFIALAGGVFRGMLRFLAVIGLLVGFSLSDRLLFPQSRISEQGAPSRTRVLLVLDQIGFSAMNDYLNREADEKLLNSIRFFRPVLPSSAAFMGRIATLLTGQEVFEHGIRNASTDSRNWQLFQESWQERLIAFQTQADFHVTNLTAPSRFSAFFPNAQDSLCPAREDEPNLYAFLARAGERLTPFIPRWVLNLAVQHGKCLPFRVPVDDLIHREIITQIMSQKHRTDMLLSLWSVNFTEYAEPLFLEDRTGTTPDHSERKHLALFVRTLVENLDRSGLLQSSEIHVVGLPDPQETYGAYFLLQPGFTRGTPWPLEDENWATPLSSLAFVVDPTRTADELLNAAATGARRSGSLAYFEESSQSAGGPLRRSIFCSFHSKRDATDDAALTRPNRVATLRLNLDRTAGIPEITTEVSDIFLPPFSSEEACTDAAVSSLSDALSRDLALFEPPLAATQSLQHLVEAVKEKAN